METKQQAPFIDIKDLSHIYTDTENNEVLALDKVNLAIRPGEFVAVIGTNGSGKSTLARHLNALLLPSEGTVKIQGMDTLDETKLWEIRQNVGMVFQKPTPFPKTIFENVAYGLRVNGERDESLIADKVEESTLKQSGAAGVIKKGKGVQVIYGPRVSVIKSDLEEYLQDPRAVEGSAVVVEPETKPEEKPEISEVFTAPIQGEAKLISETPDATFAQKMMGDGIVIFPQDGTLYAPCDATVSFVFDTKHAIGLVSEEGVEMLIHVGIDTVQLGGQGFQRHLGRAIGTLLDRLHTAIGGSLGGECAAVAPGRRLDDRAVGLRLDLGDRAVRVDDRFDLAGLLPAFCARLARPVGGKVQLNAVAVL